MSSVKRAPYVMYTPSICFYYQELISLVISMDRRSLDITYMDPYGKTRTVHRNFSFFNKEGAKELYDEIINVNNLNKEKNSKPKGVI